MSGPAYATGYSRLVQRPETLPLDRLATARLYLCTDARRERGDLAEFADAALAGGVDIIQLRDKGSAGEAQFGPLEAKQELAALEVLADAARRHGALFAVNDRADIARGARADVLHLGQELGIGGAAVGAKLQTDGLVYGHADERILNAAETRDYESGGGRGSGGGGGTVNIYGVQDIEAILAELRRQGGEHAGTAAAYDAAAVHLRDLAAAGEALQMVGRMSSVDCFDYLADHGEEPPVGEREPDQLRAALLAEFAVLGVLSGSLAGVAASGDPHHQRGARRIAPSRRITSPLSMSFSRMCFTRRA